jgi:hypothetical protein
MRRIAGTGGTGSFLLSKRSTSHYGRPTNVAPRDPVSNCPLQADGHRTWLRNGLPLGGRAALFRFQSNAGGWTGPATGGATCCKRRGKIFLAGVIGISRGGRGRTRKAETNLGSAGWKACATGHGRGWWGWGEERVRGDPRRPGGLPHGFGGIAVDSRRRAGDFRAGEGEQEKPRRISAQQAGKPAPRG